MADPTVVVDDLHVVYRVYGAGGNKGTAATSLMRLVRRQRRVSIREVHAIRGISFVVNHGDVVGVIGRNGSGKSTLLRAIAGLLPAERGAVYTSGQAALLGVNAALLDDLTGERNVVLGCLAMGMPPAEVKERYPQIVDFSGVGNFIDLPMRAYSTGMAQRLRFAIASAKSHEILMIDEALATGDAAFRTKSHNRIKELRDEAGTVFLVAHNLGEIEQSCNRVIWMEAGQILRDSDDVPGVIDEYLVATGGEPRDRERARLLSPGETTPVPPDVRAGGPDRKDGDRIRPARTHERAADEPCRRPSVFGYASARWRVRRMIVPPSGRVLAMTVPRCAIASRRTM
jgi:teichoic acid transport system ATP-binding protein